MPAPPSDPRLSFLTRLLEELPLGVIVLDSGGLVRHFNEYEARVARRQREDVVGKPFFERVAPCMNVRELRDPFFHRIGREPLSLDLDFSFPFPFMERPRDVVVRLRSFEAGGAPYGVLFVEDVSARRAVERMKETLGSLLVHDMKSPLSVALASLGFVGEAPGVKEDADALESLDDARRALRRLDRMILNLLDVTRLETQSFPLQRADEDVADLVRNTVAEVAPVARRYGVELVSELPDSPVVASFDSDVLRRAVENLVDNALRHARGRVVVRVAGVDGGARVEVEDDGTGVPDEVKEQIFAPFAQVRVVGAARGRNRGLGLTYVQLAARAHGGAASVQDASPQGTVFRMELPPQSGRPTSS